MHGSEGGEAKPSLPLSDLSRHGSRTKSGMTAKESLAWIPDQVRDDSQTEFAQRLTNTRSHTPCPSLIPRCSNLVNGR